MIAFFLSTPEKWLDMKSWMKVSLFLHALCDSVVSFFYYRDTAGTGVHGANFKNMSERLYPDARAGVPRISNCYSALLSRIGAAQEYDATEVK